MWLEQKIKIIFPTHGHEMFDLNYSTILLRFQSD